MKTKCSLLLWLCLFVTAANAQSKTYILVHGGWHGAWSWNKVVPLLEAKGNKVLAIDLPGHGDDKTPASSVTLQDCVQKVVSVANSQTGKVILVGHSMAGVIIAQAAEELGKEKVAKLVFLDAFMPKNGESVFALAGKAAQQAKPVNNSQHFPSLQESMIFSEDQKASQLKPENVMALFYHDCSKEDIEFAKSKLGWESMAVLATPITVTEARYGAVPKVYILCTKAKDLDKSSLSSNVPCEKVYTLASSHSPFFSMPEKLTTILDEL
ncbi:alpha/beta fold hydrolase [Rhodocytophaga rosea]|uniref:Alpha/beta fold hydrolase n=1 Tax=Rhodocytophaga rosea TaxID=2704465 RepID=A0A6C0GJ13_9BACT|nr:alpha/beta fold hydrolase [Rhodocytophaga rosea]QHT67784.1 alpha/beta fold hydrolase [Rhodocytophaga rosea]